MGLHHLNTGEPTENTIFSLRSNGIDTENQLVESSVLWTSELTGLDETATETSGCGNKSADIGTSTYLDDLPDHEQSGDQLDPTPTIQIPRPADKQAGPPIRRYPIRLRTPSVCMRDFWSLYSKLLDEPLSYITAIQQEEWRKTIQSEVDSILKNKTWIVTDRPTGHKPITAKWLFKIKRNSNGLINKLKARIVARGFQQKEGTDYSEVFAPMV